MITGITILFYLSVLFVMILEFERVLHPLDSLRKSLEIQEVRKSGKSLLDLNPEIRTHIILNFIALLVCLVGVFTSQWPIFIFIILLSLVATLYKRILIIRWVDSVFCSGLLLFSLVNQFHLDINIHELVLVYLGL